MKKTQKIITASVTVLAAIATAHLMQRGTQASPALTEPVAIQVAAIGPVAMGESVVRVPQTTNPVTVMAPAIVPISEAEAEAEAEAKVEIDVAAETEAEDAIMPEGPVLEAAQTAPVPQNEAEKAVMAGTYPDMPRPPADGAMPKPLPPLGPELKERMSTLDRVTQDDTTVAVPAQTVRRNAFGLSCGALLTAAPKDAAMVGLTLTDPCRGDEVFTLRHGQLVYTAKMDSLGTYAAQVPALASEARYVISFADGTQVDAEVTVSGADDIDRVALFSTGRMGLGIHALEFGADYDQSGHVWSGKARDPETAARAGGGFVTALGDPELHDAKLAEVYTFPANTKRRDGVVRLSVEVEVTAYNCGKDVAGHTLQRGPDGKMTPVTLTLAMPDCDAIGEFLVLKNLLRDLKVASN